MEYSPALAEPGNDRKVRLIELSHHPAENLNSVKALNYEGKGQMGTDRDFN